MVEIVETNERKAALILVNDLLELKAGQKLLLYLDSGSDYHLAKIIQEAAQQLGGVAELFELNCNLGLHGMAIELEKKIGNGAYDIICELSKQYFYQTASWQKAVQSSSRIYSLSGMNSDAFVSCIGRVNHALMLQFGLQLKDILMKSGKVRILSKIGTDIKLQINPGFLLRLILKLKGSNGSHVYYPSGVFTQTQRSTFMGGQLAFQGIPETIEGVAVIDGYIWPPKEIGYFDDEPVIIKFKRSSVIAINGSPSKSAILNRWFGKEPKRIKHFCIGLNPGAKLSGNLLEAERAFGCISIGIGNYPFHIDAIIRSPSIIANNKVVEQEGSFNNSELLVLEKQLKEYASKQTVSL